AAGLRSPTAPPRSNEAGAGRAAARPQASSWYAPWSSLAPQPAVDGMPGRDEEAGDALDADAARVQLLRGLQDLGRPLRIEVLAFGQVHGTAAPAAPARTL